MGRAAQLLLGGIGAAGRCGKTGVEKPLTRGGLPGVDCLVDWAQLRRGAKRKLAESKSLCLPPCRRRRRGGVAVQGGAAGHRHQREGGAGNAQPPPGCWALPCLTVPPLSCNDSLSFRVLWGVGKPVCAHKQRLSTWHGVLRRRWGRLPLRTRRTRRCRRCASRPRWRSPPWWPSGWARSPHPPAGTSESGARPSPSSAVGGALQRRPLPRSAQDPPAGPARRCGIAHPAAPLLILPS